MEKVNVPPPISGASLEVTLVLCEAAQIAEGKLSILGGGWTRISANTPGQQALGVIAKVPREMVSRRIGIELRLLDFDCRPLALRGRPVAGRAQIELARPAGSTPGDPVPVPLAFQFNDLAFKPGGYVWECRVDGDLKASWPFQAV